MALRNYRHMANAHVGRLCRRGGNIRRYGSRQQVGIGTHFWGGNDHWELIQTVPLVTGTTRYLLGSLTAYKKIRIVVNDKIVQSTSGNTWFGVYYGQNYSQALRRVLFPYGRSTYKFGFIETERDDMWWTVLAHGSNNHQTTVSSSHVCDVVEWPAGDVQVVVDFSAADAAAFSEGVFFTVYGVKA